MAEHRLAILGAGRMGAALIGGLVRSGFAAPEAIAVTERRAEARAHLEQDHPGIVTSDQLLDAEAIVLAVEPGDAATVCAALCVKRYPLAISILAGVTTGQLERQLPLETAVVRAMPNTPALVRAAASAISPGSRATEEHLDLAEQIFSSIGTVVRVPERLLDAVTGLSGSGPAYVFLLAEALIEAGVYEGLDREVARLLVTQTILGAGRMLAETAEGASTLRQAVTSPGGTTAEGLRVLEAHGIRSAVLAAVDAAAARCGALRSERVQSSGGDLASSVTGQG
jgi:pyrroline-5-carboxylate reductase